jgi:hypothetical protein
MAAGAERAVYTAIGVEPENGTVRKPTAHWRNQAIALKTPGAVSMSAIAMLRQLGTQSVTGRA